MDLMNTIISNGCLPLSAAKTIEDIEFLLPGNIDSAELVNSCMLERLPFYRQLVSQSKHKKVAIKACMRKFVVTLNVMMRGNVESAY